MRIAITQYQIENLPDFNAYKNKIETLVKEAKQQNADLLLLPEYVGLEIGGCHTTEEELYAAIQALIPQYLKFYAELAQQYQMYIQPGTLIEAGEANKYYNRAYFFAPNGKYGYQDKLQLVESEKESQLLLHGKEQTLFETAFGKIGIAICYDSEFPEIVRNLTLAGAWLILVPSYTVTRSGFNRVFLSCRARAIENQCYVAISYAVGKVALNKPFENAVGQCCMVGPADVGFPDNGVLAQSNQADVPEMLFLELSPEKIASVRRHGMTHNFEDSKTHPAKISSFRL